MRFLPETGSRLEQKTRKQSSDWFPDWNKMLRETTLEYHICHIAANRNNWYNRIYIDSEKMDSKIVFTA